MICSYLDPGMALFLAESPQEDDQSADPAAWLALLATALLALVTLTLVP